MKSVLEAAAMSLVISDFANAEETRGKALNLQRFLKLIFVLSHRLLRALVEKRLLKICGHATPSHPGIVVW